MFGRFVRDESGMAMGLVVVMIVLISVMGAGLLTFASRDLEHVVEVNRGQKAFEMADAGAELARQQLWLDSQPGNYDVDGAETSPYDATCDITGDEPNADETWSPENGVARSNLDDNSTTSDQVTVKIRYLNPTAVPSVCRPPKPPAADERYFQVVSTGNYEGSKRKVEAIYSTYDLGVPKAFFARDSMTISGSSCITGVSLFTEGNLTFNGGGGGTGCGGGLGYIRGTDNVYKRWAETPADAANSYPNRFNSTARTSTAAGFGAVGNIENSMEVSGRDYDVDGHTPNNGTVPPYFKLPVSSPQTNTEITFPFNSQPDILDANRLCEVARDLGGSHYQEVTSNGSYALSNWPSNSTHKTIVCVDWTAGNGAKNVNWAVEGTHSMSGANDPTNRYPDQCEGPSAKGVLIVRDANFSTAQNKALFEGVIAVRGGTISTGDYTDTGGNTCIQGFASASDDIAIRGDVEPESPADISNTPGFRGVSLWSWRELYE